MKIFGIHEFLPDLEIIKFLGRTVCDSETRIFCEDILFILCGFDRAQLNAVGVGDVGGAWGVGCGWGVGMSRVSWVWGVGTSVGMSMVSWVWGVGGAWVGRRVWVGFGDVCGHVDGKLGVGRGEWMGRGVWVGFGDVCGHVEGKLGVGGAWGVGGV